MKWDGNGRPEAGRSLMVLAGSPAYCTFTMTVSVKLPAGKSTVAWAMTLPDPGLPVVKNTLTFLVFVPLLPSVKALGLTDVIAVTAPVRLALTVQEDTVPQFKALAVKLAIVVLCAGAVIGEMVVKKRQPSTEGVRGPVGTTASEVEQAAVSSRVSSATCERIVPPSFETCKGSE